MAADPRPRTHTDAIDVPPWLRVAGGVAWRVLIVALAVAALAWLLDLLTVVVVPLALALLLAGASEPAVRRLDHDRLPDWTAPLVVVLAALVLTIAVVGGIGARLAQQLPDLGDELSGAVADVESSLGVDLPSVGDLVPGASSQGASSQGAASQGPSSQGTEGAARAARAATEVLFGAFLTFALAFLLLKDGSSMWRWLVGLVGEGARADVDAAGRAAWDTLGTYVRGLTVVAVFDAVAIAAGLLALGVPLVLTLGALQLVASYVPTIGAFVAGAVAVAVALASGGLVTAGLTLALVIAVQQIGNDVIEPWVMGRSLPIRPIAVLLAVSAGAVLWGIAGALLFVPLTAAASAAAHTLQERRATA